MKIITKILEMDLDRFKTNKIKFFKNFFVVGLSSALLKYHPNFNKYLIENNLAESTIINVLWILIIPILTIIVLLLTSKFLINKIGLKKTIFLLAMLNIMCKIGIGLPNIGFFCS